MDPATAKLAVELQLEDIDEIIYELNERDDLHEASVLTRANYEDILKVVEGQVLALGILRADHANRVQFVNLVEEERQATQDHELACRLAGLATPAPTFGYPTKDIYFSDDEITVSSTTGIRTLNAADPTQTNLYFNEDNGSALSVVEGPKSSTFTSSSSYTGKGKGKAKQVISDNGITHALCSACMDRHPRFDVLELSCKRKDDIAPHAYCRTCLVDLFECSLTDTTLFPPRCCGMRISLYAGAHFFTPQLVTRIEEKDEELRTSDPTYCSNRSCAKFIPPANIKAAIATCGVCDQKTCTTCKNPEHKGLCPEDPAVKQLIDVAEEKRWQRCYKCRTMVELDVGCFHMYCRCGGQFCYLCAAPWKTCTCPQWHEERLLRIGRMDDAVRPALAHQIAMPERREMPEANPVREVAADMHLRLATVASGFLMNGEPEEETDEQGGCVHQWERIFRSAEVDTTCSICQHHLRFVNSCERCSTRLCNRCINNRLGV